MTLQKSILINNIKLWKLNQPVLSKNIEGLRGITLQDNENVTLLDETNDIVDYWAEEQIPLKKCIHVIVELLEQPVVASAWSSSVLTYEQPVTDKKLWVRYNDERVFLPENILGLLRVFNVGDLVPIIKSQLKIKGDIAIRNGNDILEVDDVSSSSKEKGKEKEMEIKEKVEMLVASHMATAICVSDDRTDLLCTYPSDPILASGALKGIIEVGLENCLDTLLEQFSRGVVEAGERGELVGRISFLEAYIRAVKESQESPYTYLEKVPLPLFLKSLRKGIDKKLDNLLTKMELDQAEIGFNHWTSLLASNKDYVKEGGYKYLTAALVKEAYHSTAFKMPLGFPTIDHVIPFKYQLVIEPIIMVPHENCGVTRKL
ncbi:hypothetical protein RhiirA4_448739 [Rhizophagus irregularis]|uniref:Uncharacterized protein n=1 Tax=Rhizophagus irregularis TaxID=588596 RepID=A0A2I1HCF6_9GLOM|nr:hypothetical protein RhiirA4_448739 [Rhizophagus irregularis]